MTQPSSRQTQRVKGNGMIHKLLSHSTYQTTFFFSVWELVTFGYMHEVDYLDTDIVPFDVHLLGVSMFVIEKETNQSIPIVTLTTGRAPGNFDLSSTEVETTRNYTYDSDTGPTTINVNARIAQIEAKRSRFPQALTMCLFLVNWTLTVGSIYIVVLVIFGRGGINDAVLLLPVTIILTIPTLRSLYPGSPPFGVFIGKSRALRS